MIRARASPGQSARVLAWRTRGRAYRLPRGNGHGLPRPVLERRPRPARAGKEHRPRGQQVHAVARSDEGASGAARRRLGRGALRPDEALRHDVRQDDRGRAREGVGLRDARRERRGGAARAEEVHGVGRLDLLAAAPPRQGRRPEGRPHRRHRRGARAPRAGLRTRPDQEDPAADPPRGAQARARVAAGRALPGRHGRRRPLRGGRGAAQARRGERRADAPDRSHRRRKTACGCASASPTASPSWAGRSPTGAPRSRRSCPTRSRSKRAAPTCASRRNPERRNNRQPCRNAKTSRQSWSSGPVRS